jgi:DNA-binding SARP family transcriptional activator/tetratricopeptide (TPR) repeat protein
MASRQPCRILVVAAAGYGKTTRAETDLPDGGLRCTAARAVTTLGSSIPSALLVEDLHEVSAAERVELLHTIGRLPDGIAVTLTSRDPLDAESRGLLRGQVFERGPADLALTPHALARVLADEYQISDPEAPARVHAFTRGWPALVHFAADALSRRPGDDCAVELSRPGSAAARWLETNVLAALPDPVYRVLSEFAQLDPLPRDLVDAEAFEWLRLAGLIVSHPRLELLGREGFSVVPAIASLLTGANVPAADARLVQAGAWYEQHELPFAAAHAYSSAGQTVRAQALVASRGSDMVAQGDASGVVALVSGIDSRQSSPAVQLAYAEALHRSGDSHAALRAYGPVAEVADLAGWDARLAHRVAAVQHTQGAIPEALETLDRLSPESVSDDSDGINWRVCRAKVLSMLGRDQEARDLAAETLRLAERTGTPGCLTAAHQAMAKASSGARKEAHLDLALASARRAGDVVSVAAILGNQSYVLLASARYTEAAEVAREAVRAAEVSRPTGALIAALHNLGEALTRVGEFAEARWHLERAVAISRRLGPNRIAAGLCGLGELHRATGKHEQARTAYDEAVLLSRASNELQVLVPALAGLARLLAETSSDGAQTAAVEAFRLAPPSLASFARTALGWVSLAQGHGAQAAVHAEESVAAARSSRALDLLAEALEVAAECTDDPHDSHAALTEALGIWRHGGAEPSASRVEVRLGRLEGADSTTRSRAREAARRLQHLGVAFADGRAFGAAATAKSVNINVLGPFQVIVDGRPVPLPAWRSRQARTLVKILVGRRGLPTTRGHLCELLWPDDDPAKTPHRLSVLLATVRGVLDPGKAWPAEHYIASDPTGVWLDLRRVMVDAERLLADASHAAALLADGQTDLAREILGDINHRYGGHAFEDEPYEDWAEVLREETRCAWLRSLRHLAMLSLREGGMTDACALLVRLLGADPYDERMHRVLVKALVRTGRHGEARRAFDQWTRAMAVVDAPHPDPRVLVVTPR